MIIGTAAAKPIHCGRAEDKATKAFASRHAAHGSKGVPFVHFPKKGWACSKVGFGGYRVSVLSTHGETLKNAILAGINVIDTSAHFENGKSEEMIGKAIDNLIHNGLVKRQELVIITKAGYIQSQNGLAIGGQNTAKIQENMFHGISPEFIEKELTASLDRLGLDHIDCFMLNNPERMLHATNFKLTPTMLYDLILKAFTHLEHLVQKGRIGSYGICSHSISIPTAPDHISLHQLIQSYKASSDGGTPQDFHSKYPHFLGIQYPLNLYEQTALSKGSVSEIAKTMGLFQIVHRPLNVITKGQVRTLRTDYKLPIQDEALSTQSLVSSLNAVHDLEARLADNVGSKIPDTSSLVSKFIWADIIADNTQPLLNNLFAAEYYFTKKLLPTVAVDIKALEASAKQCVEAGVDQEEKDDGNEALKFLEKWKADYQVALNKMILHFLDVCRSRDFSKNKELAEVLATLINTSRENSNANIMSSSPSSSKKSAKLATLAIKTVASHPNVDIVLVGMRSDQYVKDALDAVCHSEKLESAQQQHSGLLKKEDVEIILENMAHHQKM